MVEGWWLNLGKSLHARLLSLHFNVSRIESPAALVHHSKNIIKTAIQDLPLRR